MDDLISRQAAIDVCNKAIDLWQGQLGEGIVIAVRKKIEELPSAQPEPLTLRVNHELTKEEYDKLMHDIKDAPIVLLPPAQSEIIRCKDCKHWKNKHLCESLSRYGSLETKANFYCGYAERREE